MRGPSPKIGLVFQEYSLFPWRNVMDNIAFGLEMQKKPRAERYRIAEQYLKLVGLTQFATSYPSELSGGMRQRVAVARALALDPVLLLMDEPFGALDAQTRNMLQKELLEIWEKTRKTIVFITHSVDEAVYLADRIIVLTPRPGRICKIVSIDLPRPRNRTNVEFAQVRRDILDLISSNCSVQ
jgi:NitT/TauT family transport system ATP-binding protein